MYAGRMASYGLSRKVCTFALLLGSVGVSDRIPKSVCEEYPTFKGLFREQLHRFALAFGPGICHHARPRAPTHTRAPVSPPPDGVRGGGDTGGARVVWVVEYMCIYEPGHIRCRVRFRTRCRFRPTPSLRCAPLRGSVIEPRSDSCPSPAPVDLHPPGVPAKGAAALGRRSPRGSSGVFGPRRRGFPRVAVSRLAPLRCARSTRPPLGPLGDLELRRRSTSRLPLVPLRAPSCWGEGRTCPSEAVRALLTDFYPAPALPEGSGPKRRSEWLTRLLRNLDAGSGGVTAPSFRGGARRPPGECDDTHDTRRPSRFAFAPGMGFNKPITAEGAKLSGPAAAIQRRAPGPP